MILLNRQQFNESVFKRDKFKCVVCKDIAVDAHHILDRKLFNNGGYFIDNGVSLCSPCHIKAENSYYTCEYLRNLAGISNIIIPDSMYITEYDKWGNFIIDNKIELHSMSFSQKYPRTYHFDFSPGTTSDDRINHQWWEDILAIPQLIVTEKLDGSNSCLNKYGVFARSHATPSEHPWDRKLREHWSILKHDLGDLEIFGENMYAVHSIEYDLLTSDFYVFAIRHDDVWLSWEEVCFYATYFGFPTVPVFVQGLPAKDKTSFEQQVKYIIDRNSMLGSIDGETKQVCSMEGIVVRNSGEFTTYEFEHNVFKWVRKNHVKTNEHWSKNWNKANIRY